MGMVNIKVVDESNYKACFNIKVKDEQEKFITNPIECLAKAYVYREFVYPFAIYNDDLVIGFVMIRFNKEFNNYFIWQFMIDEKYQGKGYGKQSMNRVLEWIKCDGKSNEVVITYIEGDDIAKNLYTSLGFKEFQNFDGEVDKILTV